VLDTCVLLPEVGDVEAGFDAGADVVEGGGLPLDDEEATRMWKVDRFRDRLLPATLDEHDGAAIGEHQIGSRWPSPVSPSCSSCR
jgi:hypothetical protein